MGDCIGGRYRLVGPLSEGGMGSVWRAEHLELGVPVAVKFPHVERTSHWVSRFRREARAAARLCSPHVVRVLDFGLDEGHPYLAMELLEGESLRARLEREIVISVEEVSKITCQAARALDCAHAAGVVHRDLKPSNLFLHRAEQGEIVKLVDFGIAKWRDPAEGGAHVDTASDQIVGSASYMSPEQARGEEVDARSDVWSLGVVAYQMITGVLPFRGGNLPDTLRCVCSGRFEPASSVVERAYRPLDAVFQRALELDRERRFASAGAFADAFCSAMQHVPAEKRTFRRPAGAEGWTLGRKVATLTLPPARRRVTRPWTRSVLVLSAIAALASSVVAVLHESPEAMPSGLPATAEDERLALLTTVEPTRELREPPAPSSVATAPADRTRPSPSARVAGPLRTPIRTARAPEATTGGGAALGERTQIDPLFGLEVPAPR